MSCYFCFVLLLLDLSCGECNVISLYVLCCSVNGSVGEHIESVHVVFTARISTTY